MRYRTPEVPDFPADDEDEADIRRRVRSKFKKAYSTEPDSVKSHRPNTIYGRTSDMVKMRDRYERQARTSSVDSDFGPWEPDNTAQVRGRTREVYRYDIAEPVGGHRSMSMEPSYSASASDLDLDLSMSTVSHVTPLHARAVSLTRIPTVPTPSAMEVQETVRRAVRRAHSVADLDDDDDTLDVAPRKRIIKRFPHRADVATLKYETPTYISPYTDKDVESTVKGDYRFHISELEKDRRKGDISSYILPHDEKFEPDNIVVTPVSGGKKQVVYTKQNLSGHATDPREAKAALDNVVRRTKFMQDSMTELEKFVRRNRSLFPEDTTIHQEYKFYMLTEEELLKIGESPDAEVYGVKIIEKLVVPAGTEIAHILKRFYGKSDVEVEYSRRRKGEPIEDETGLVDHKYLKDDMRRKVEMEYESRHRAGDVHSRYLPTYKSPVTGDVDFKEYAHLYTRITPRTLKKIYGEPREGEHVQRGRVFMQILLSVWIWVAFLYDTTPYSFEHKPMHMSGNVTPQ